jgi:pimeloyl-ACP methyl ester carboxylesterase
MKLKLAQKLLLRYYITQLKTIAVVSPRRAAEKAFRLFCTPYAGKPQRKAPAVFHKAKKINFPLDGNRIAGYHWLPEHPNGKKILIAHGFSSNAAKFEKYVNPLLLAGFEVLAFDAPGHGHSSGYILNAYIYRNMLLHVETLYGPVYGIMGHSLGGLAAALTMEMLPDNNGRKLVLVAPATETETAVQNFFRMIRADEKLQLAFRQYISELTEHPATYFSVSRVVAAVQTPVLWVHDRRDTICPFADVAPVMAGDHSHIRFHITEGLGHSRIYKENAVCQEIVAFFTADTN